MSHAQQTQQVSFYPETYNLYFTNIPLFEPAYISEEHKAEFITNSKFLTGAFKKISNYSLSASYYLNKKEKSFQGFRIILSNEKEGPYINKPRGGLNYAYQVALSENTRIAAGAYLGLAGINFNTPSASGVSNFTVPDAGIGLNLKHKDYYFAISSLQILNTDGTSLSNPITFRRFYNLYIAGKKIFSENLNFKYNLLWRILPTKQNETGISGAFAFKETVDVGLVVKLNNSISAFSCLYLGENKNILFSFAYNSPTFSSISAYHNAFELNLGYRL